MKYAILPALLILGVLAIIVALAITGYGAKVTAFIVPLAWGVWCVNAGMRHNRTAAR